VTCGCGHTGRSGADWFRSDSAHRRPARTRSHRRRTGARLPECGHRQRVHGRRGRAVHVRRRPTVGARHCRGVGNRLLHRDGHLHRRARRPIETRIPAEIRPNSTAAAIYSEHPRYEDACETSPRSGCRANEFARKITLEIPSRAIASSLSSLPVCRVVLRIPRARHQRLVVDMLATDTTDYLDMSRWLKVAYFLVYNSIPVTRPTRATSS